MVSLLINPLRTLLFLQFLLIADRPSEDSWADFIQENKERFTEVFAELYDEIAGDDQ